jgi:hypothetical protein
MLGALAAGTTVASATVLDWNFQDHLGVLGTTQTFTAGGFNLTARGFTPGDVGTAMFGKNGGGDENGLGLNNDPSGDHEITAGNFVQVNLDGIRSSLAAGGFSFQMGSTTQGEGWAVYGSEDGSPFTLTLLAQSSGTNDEGFHTLAGGYDNYNFFYFGGGPGACGAGCNGNVLLTNFDATLSAVPLPATLPLFGGALALGGLFLKRRKNRLGSIA